MDYFGVELLPALKELLDHPSDSIEYALLQSLEDARARFLAFLDLAPPNAKEKQDIESGSLPSSRGITLFNDSVKQGIFSLSTELNASEHYCAKLIEHVLPDATQPVTTSTVHSAILCHFRERVALLQSLRLVFESAARSDAPQSRTRHILQKYLYDMVKGPFSLARNAPPGNLAAKLLFEIDTVKAEISKQSSRIPTSDEPTTEWLQAFIQLLHEQRRQLGHLLFLVAAAGQMQPADVMLLVKWLAKVTDTNDCLSIYVLVSVFQAISPVTEDEDSEDEIPIVFKDPQLFVNLSAALNSAWPNADLRSAMLLQYSLFHLEVRSRDLHVRGEVSVIEDEVGASLKKAISMGAFQALSRILLRSRDPRFSLERPEFSLAADDTVLSGRAVHLDVVDEQALVPPDFRAYLLNSVNDLVTSLIQRLSRTLRDVRKQEEDVSHGGRASRNFSHSTASGGASAHDTPLQHNTESLFRLIAIIYDEKESDAGLCFWTDEDGGRLYPFLRWAAESRQPGTIVGMLDMMVSLARGQSCAAFAYNFLSTGGGHYTSASEEGYSSPGSCSWSTLFMALHHYETRLPSVQGGNPSASPPSHQQLSPGLVAGAIASNPPRFSLQPSEISMLGSFLRLLRNVARFSPIARFALHENRDFRALQTIFTMASHSIPLELKAMLFDSLSAFAAPGGGPVAVDLVHQMWAILEKMEIIPVRGIAPSAVLSGRIGRPVGGAIVELEVIEAAGKTYPATLALIQLLNSLIHTPQKALTLRAGYEAESKTIPSNLGSGYRLPGLKPYVDFVIDKVFVKVFEREYAFADEQWQVIEASLCFIEKSLASFDLGSVANLAASVNGLSGADRNKAVSVLSTVATHPGFFVMKSILGNPMARRNLLYIVDDGFGSFFPRLNTSYARNKAALRTFRIMHRVLQVQGLYGEILIPMLNDIGELPGIGPLGFPLSSLVPLDACILQSPHTIPNIAVYITVQDPQIPYFVVQVIRGLSDHPNFNWGQALDPIVAAVEATTHRAKILAGFVAWLESDVPDDDDNVLPVDQSAIEDAITVGAPGVTDVRHGIVDLLLHNTRTGSAGHNIAHFLLGIHRGSKSETVVDDSGPSDRSCLHAIIGLLNRGTSIQDRVASSPPLNLTHPSLADRCYRLIYQLCTHPFSSAATIRYLRSRERFFISQLVNLPIRIPHVVSSSSGRVSYSDGMSIETTSAALTSSLRVQSTILHCLALELRVLHESSQLARLEELIDGLFGAVDLSAFGDGRGEYDVAGPGQPLTRMLHMLDSFLLQWEDPSSLSSVTLQLFAGINWEASLRMDEYGCQIYDSRQLISMIKDARLALQRAGSLSVAGGEQQLRTETNFVLETAVRENRARELAYVKGIGLAAWATLLEVALTNGFDSIRPERREVILHDLLLALPQHITTSPPTTATILSTTYLLLVSKLRESTIQQSHLSSPSLSLHSNQPSERLHSHMKNAWECVLQHGTTERTRGNLYSAMVRYMQIVQEFEQSSRQVLAGVESGSHVSRDVTLSEPSHRTSSLVGTIQIINMVADKVTPIICRDAIDGSEVWKTVSFTLLGVLIHLTHNERSQKVLTAMVRGGYLQTIVGSVRESSNDMVRILQSENGSLNSLYVYEAKMSLLLRLSEYRTGAERLVESRIFNSLSAFEALDLSPMTGDDIVKGLAGFLPTANERYNQIVVPALQVAVGCLSTVGQSVGVVLKQGCDFLLSHRDSFAMILSERSQSWSSINVCLVQLLVAVAALVYSQAKLDSERFKPIHSSILSLATRCFAPQQPRYNSESRDAFNVLQQWLTTYMVNVMETEEQTQLISMDSTVGSSMLGAFTAKLPKLSDVATTLSVDIETLDLATHECKDIRTRLRESERIPPEEIEEILAGANLSDEASSWSFAQKRAMSSRVLAQSLKSHLENALDALYRVELLLFLLTVHLENAFSRDLVKPAATRMTSSLRSNPILQGPQTQARESVAVLLMPSLSTLEDVDLELIMAYDTALARRAFLNLMAKRIQTVVTSESDWEIIM